MGCLHFYNFVIYFFVKIVHIITTIFGQKMDVINLIYSFLYLESECLQIIRRKCVILIWLCVILIFTANIKRGM